MMSKRRTIGAVGGIGHGHSRNDTQRGLYKISAKAKKYGQMYGLNSEAELIDIQQHLDVGLLICAGCKGWKFRVKHSRCKECTPPKPALTLKLKGHDTTSIPT